MAWIAGGADVPRAMVLTRDIALPMLLDEALLLVPATVGAPYVALRPFRVHVAEAEGALALPLHLGRVPFRNANEATAYVLVHERATSVAFIECTVQRGNPPVALAPAEFSPLVELRARKGVAAEICAAVVDPTRHILVAMRYADGEIWMHEVPLGEEILHAAKPGVLVAIETGVVKMGFSINSDVVGAKRVTLVAITTNTVITWMLSVSPVKKEAVYAVMNGKRSLMKRILG